MCIIICICIIIYMCIIIYICIIIYRWLHIRLQCIGAFIVLFVSLLAVIGRDTLSMFITVKNFNFVGYAVSYHIKQEGLSAR
jgi:hypothetical protein